MFRVLLGLLLRPNFVQNCVTIVMHVSLHGKLNRSKKNNFRFESVKHFLLNLSFLNLFKITNRDLKITAIAKSKVWNYVFKRSLLS